ncbi:MAG: YeeE/YedE thiosulfate transporter family protein [Mangrovicoccus sp.]|nr:YeeE/YedE thiosulfate transporter family protein [Mangrovicoccus sp.]
MQMDWIWGLIGGGIIGLAGALFLLVNGRVMGASGIIGGLVDGSGRSNAGERLSFLAGLMGAPIVVVLLSGWQPESNVTGNIAALVVGGLAVGIGTRLANGCTSGHGVCGISRLSTRGIVATLIYMAAGGVAVTLFRTILGVV